MKAFSIAVVACSAFGAQAASSVGTLGNVVGNVSVGGQGFVTHAKNGVSLAEGSTVLVSSKGKATVALANGCTVSLLGSQHYTVDSKLSCEQSIASVKSLAATTRVADLRPPSWMDSFLRPPDPPPRTSPPVDFSGPSIPTQPRVFNWPSFEGIGGYSIPFTFGLGFAAAYSQTNDKASGS